MYPIFITDDPEAEVEIKSLPRQKRCMSLAAEPTDIQIDSKHTRRSPSVTDALLLLLHTRRWGINKLKGFIAPLVAKGLRSVILFGVPLASPKVCLRLAVLSYRHCLSDCVPARTHRTIAARLPMTRPAR